MVSGIKTSKKFDLVDSNNSYAQIIYDTEKSAGIDRDGEGDSPGEKAKGGDSSPGSQVTVVKASTIGGERNEWSKNIEFVLACIGNAVGLGNLWRFPYLVHESGGGAFLIPYFIMLILTGIPLLYMEMAVGQYTRRGPVGALQALCPIFQGAGAGTVMLSFLLCTYYNVILAWGLYYMANSVINPLPWSNCNNPWNNRNACFVNTVNLTAPNGSVSPSEEFFKRNVLEETDGLHNLGGIRWELFGLLTLAWVIVYLCLWKGLRWTGKVVYFTALFPYVVIIALLIRGVTLPGADRGIEYFVNPKWELLLTPKVWINAAAQNFNSIGIAFGSMIAFSSYTKRDHKIFRDVMTICSVNSFTSILAGFTVFSVLGHIAYNQNKEVQDVVEQGPGLVFIIYPVAFSGMQYPLGQILAFLFFFMLLCLAVDSQFASVEVVVTTLEDHFKKTIRRYLKRREVLVLLVCLTAFLLGIPVITQGGIYIFKIMDFYSSGISLMLIALFEVVAIAWFYGARRLGRNVQEMTGSAPFIYFIICWYAISPAFIATIMIFNWVFYQPIQYGKYQYPPWGEGIGWGISCLSIICIPIGAVNALYQAKGETWKEKFEWAFSAHVTDHKDEECVTMDTSSPSVVNSEAYLVRSLYKRKMGDMDVTQM